MKVKTWANSNEFPKQYEKNLLPSATVPDQTMSIREILRRYAQGLPIGGQKVPLYDEDAEDNDLPDTAHMDLAERQAIREDVEAELAELQEKIKASKNQKKSNNDKTKSQKTEPTEEPDVVETVED